MNRRIKSYQINDVRYDKLTEIIDIPVWISGTRTITGNKPSPSADHTLYRLLTDYSDKFFGIDCMPDERAMIIFTNYDSEKGTFYIKSASTQNYLGIYYNESESKAYWDWTSDPCELTLIGNSAIGKTFTVGGTTKSYKLGIDSGVGYYIIESNYMINNYYILDNVKTYIPDALSDIQEGLSAIRTHMGLQCIGASAIGQEITDHYVNPKGSMTTDRTGTYNVRNYNEMIVAAPSAVLDVTDNGVYPTSGYGTFNVNVQSDISTYFNQNFSQSTDDGQTFVNNDYFLKLPPIDCQGKTNLSNTFWDWPLSITPKLTNTSSNTNLSYTFYSCKSKIIDVSDMDTSNVTTMTYTFNGCVNVEVLDLSNFNTAKVTTMDATFERCQSLRRILGIENLDTHLVTTSGSMFNGCYKLEGDENYTLDLSNWDWSKIISNTYGPSYGTSTAFNNFFQDCRKLQHIVGLPDLSSNTKIKCISQMFRGCSALQEVDLSKFNWNFLPANAASYLVTGCSCIKCLGTGESEASDTLVFTKATISGVNGCLSLGKNTDYTLNINDAVSTSWDFNSAFASVDNRKITINLKMKPNTTWTFPYLSSVARYKGYDLVNETRISDEVPRTDLTLNFIDATNIQYSSGYMTDCYVKHLTITGLKQSSAQNRGYLCYDFKGEKVTFKDCVFYDQSFYSYLFYLCSNLKSIELINCTFSLLPNTAFYMFNGCSTLTQVDLSTFDFSSVNNFSYMFANCYALVLPNLPTNIFQGKSNLNLSSMFNACRAFTTVNFNDITLPTDYSVNLGSFISDCTSLTSFTWDNVVNANISNMFTNDQALKTISLKGLTTVSNWSYAFSSCRSLEVLDIRSATVSTFQSLTSGYVFINVPSTCTIVVADDTTKTWAQSNNILQRFTIKTAAEYDAE